MKKFMVLALVSLVLIFSHSAFALDSMGQTVYVGSSWNDITTTGQNTTSRLVIRNLDQRRNIVIKSVTFLDPDGVPVKNLMDGFDCTTGQPPGPYPTSITLLPLGTTSFITRTTTICLATKYSLDGGRPAWLVVWETADKKPVVAPFISASLDILTPLSIFGIASSAVIIDAELAAGGIVLSEKR